MSTALPRPEVFVNEDVSKPENRVNLALFSLMLIPSIRDWLLKELSLPQDSIVYPPQNSAGLRPDFVVVNPDNTVVAWIEVELGSENTAQLIAYRNGFQEPVRSIVGAETDRGDVSLEKIATALNSELSQNLDRQQTTNVGVFTTLVSTLAGYPQMFTYTDPNAEIRNNSLIRALQAHLEDVLQYGAPPVIPGTAQVSTITQKGWTIRVYSKAAKGGSVSLLWDQTMGRSRVRVPSCKRLSRCFPTASTAIESYTVFFDELGVDIRTLAEAQSQAIDENRLLPVAARLADCIRDLATIYGTNPIASNKVLPMDD